MPECEIFNQFQIFGDLVQVEPCSIGHINSTFVATYDQGGTKLRYVHQKINTSIFKDPVSLMDNMARVTRHLRHKLERQGADQITRRCITIVPTRNGELCHRASDGTYWRTFVFLEGLKTFEAVEAPAQAYEAARAFGRFQSQLVDLPGERLAETIPGFHNSRKRFDDFKAALERDSMNRAQSVKREIGFALEHEPLVHVIPEAMERKEIPERITHNDTKFNNVMFDIATGEAMCVVDLDTVMPGCSLFDFGDMVRATTTPTLEDELDLSKVGMRMPFFEKLAQGYLAETGSFLTQKERSLIAFSGKLFAYTLGLRFLTDHLSGDTYFRIHRPNQNLDRCRTQFKLAESIEQQEEAMQRFVDAL